MSKARDNDLSLAPETNGPAHALLPDQSTAISGENRVAARAAALGCADISDSHFYARGNVGRACRQVERSLGRIWVCSEPI